MKQNSFLASSKNSYLNREVQSLPSFTLPFLLLAAIITLILNLHWAKKTGMAYLKSRLILSNDELAKAAGIMRDRVRTPF